jgi:L-fuculose-phosphate aldolase
MKKLKYPGLRREVIETCLKMNAEGINQGTSGNVSVRSDEGFLITASGIVYEKMKPAHVIEMDLRAIIGDYLPSTEWRSIWIFSGRGLKPRPSCMCIRSMPLLACLRREVPAFHYMIGVTGGTSLRVSDYAEFGTQELSDTMLKAMEGRTACLLANHGQICFGPSLSKALWLAGEIESLCHQYWAACLAGKPVILDEVQMVSVLKRFKTYGKQPEDLARGETSTVLAPRFMPTKNKKKGKS